MITGADSGFGREFTKLFLQEMVKRNDGKILQLASTVSFMPVPKMAVYAATKAFVLSFTEAVQDEIEGTNVTMTALCPGASDTDFFNKANAEDTHVVQDTGLSDPAQVAKDGYEALMKGEKRVVSGLKNKLQTSLSNFVPDRWLAAGMSKLMGEKEQKKEDKSPPFFVLMFSLYWSLNKSIVAVWLMWPI